MMRRIPDDAMDVAILDPPYSERQHKGVRSGKRNLLPDGTGKVDGCSTRRVVDLGFDHFTRPDCLRMCHELARLVKRWSLVFCDDDLLPIWWAMAKKAGLQVVRTGVWVRIGGTPQFSGDRPACGAEYVVILHRPGRKQWSGGGHAAVYTHPIVVNRKGHHGPRVHTTQKPLSLMLELVDLYSEPGEVIFDPTAGSCTTGVAAIRSGRMFIGIEKNEGNYMTGRDRMEAEIDGMDLHVARRGQAALFPRA